MTFQIGDRVRCNSPDTYFFNCEGTITEVQTSGWYTARWDQLPADWLALGNTDHGGCWSENYIELIEEFEPVVDEWV